MPKQRPAGPKKKVVVNTQAWQACRQGDHKRCLKTVFAQEPWFTAGLPEPPGSRGPKFHAMCPCHCHCHRA